MMELIAKVLGFVLGCALVLFVSPLIVYIAYQMAQPTFTCLPDLTFWQVFWITLALRTCFKPAVQKVHTKK